MSGFLGQASTDLQALTSSDYLVDTGIKAAERTNLGQHLKSIGIATATGAAIGTAIGTAVPLIGNAIGSVVGAMVGAVVGVIPLLQSILNPCEFMVRGEGDVSCDEFPGRVKRAADWVKNHPQDAAVMSPAELATKFGIYESQEEARHGMGPDAAPLMELPEAREILRMVQVPMLSAFMTTVPPSSFDAQLPRAASRFPAVTPADVRTIEMRIGESPGRTSLLNIRLKSPKERGYGTVGTLAMVGGLGLGALYLYARSTRQTMRGAAKGLYRKVIRK